MADQICSHCNALVPANARFCQACGQLMQAPALMDTSENKPCPRCGYLNFNTANVCSHCGHLFVKPKRAVPVMLSCAGLFGMMMVCLVLIAVLYWVLPNAELQDQELAQLPANLTPVPGVRVGQLAPDFVLGNSSGREDSLHQKRGKPVIINFWASWCGPCKSEMADLNTFYQEESARYGLVVLAVNTGDTSRTNAEALIREKQLRFTILWDEKNLVGKQYNVRAYPTSFFIDRQGIIRAVRIGSMSRLDMDKSAMLIH